MRVSRYPIAQETDSTKVPQIGMSRGKDGGSRRVSFAAPQRFDSATTLKTSLQRQAKPKVLRPRGTKAMMASGSSGTRGSLEAEKA